MILSKITLSNFRNFDTKKVVLHPSTTIITGPNSIGKTNLLEAMYVLITGAGIRDEKQDELIKIGEKTATTLIQAFGTVENIYKNLKALPTQTREKLEKGRKEAKMSKKLATIVRNVPLKIDFEKTSKWDIDSPKVLDLFSEFGFKTLTERIKKVGKEIDLEKQGALF